MKTIILFLTLLSSSAHAQMYDVFGPGEPSECLERANEISRKNFEEYVDNQPNASIIKDLKSIDTGIRLNSYEMDLDEYPGHDFYLYEITGDFYISMGTFPSTRLRTFIRLSMGECSLLRLENYESPIEN